MKHTPKLLITNPQLFKRRFLAKTKRHANGCLEWIGSIGKRGYGRVNARTGIIYAHQVSFLLFNGPIEDGKEIMHSCDNPCCVEPSHLKAGTHEENMKDAAAKGRMVSRKGISNLSSKLTESQVLEIYGSPDKNRRGFVFRMAKKMKINRNVIYSILSGRRWSHVTRHNNPGIARQLGLLQ